MKKSMRKANATLERAYKYVASIDEKRKAKPIKQQEPPKVEAVFKPNHPGKRIDSAEIKKLDRGHFFIVIVCGGKRIEYNKRFKSATKAKEWISTHEYLKED